MNLLDARTVILSYILSNGICAFVVGSLWIQDRRRFAGLGFWLADFVLQFSALLLIALRGIIPDFISATVSNAFIIGGTILLYIGLEQFIGKPSKQIHNIILLAVFIFAHAYFILVFPSLDVRTIILSVGLLVICFQCVWLMLYRVDTEMRSITRTVGIVFIIFCLISLVRILVDLVVPLGNDFFHSDLFDTSLVMAYQMLFIILSLVLFLMVNRRLLVEQEHDIVERQRAVELLSLSEEKFFRAFHASPDAITISRMSDGTYVEVNDSFTKMSEYSREEALGSSSTSLGIWAETQTRDEFISILQTKKQVQDFECDLRTKSGAILRFLISGEIVYLNQEAHILSVSRNITAQRLAEQRLYELSRAVEQSPSSILITNTNGTIEYVNSRFTQLTGYSAEEVLGQNPRILQSGKTPAETYHQLWDALTLGKEFRGEFLNKKRNGDLYYQLGIISPITDSRGIITHYLAVSEDITSQKMAEAEIQHLHTQLREQAVRDPLTGLYNRRYLDEILERELARAQRGALPISFAMIDIDHFKKINDAFSHVAGDAGLQKLAHQILGQVRTSDIICRYGGDEFLVILPNITAEISLQIAERWRRSFMGSTLPLEYGSIRCTISCGISEYPVHGKTSEELIFAADKALYQAKSEGRNCTKIYIME